MALPVQFSPGRADVAGEHDGRARLLRPCLENYSYEYE